MRGRRGAWAVLATVAVAALAACGSVEPYAAKIDGDRISQEEFNRDLEAILANRGYLDQTDEVLAQRGRRARGEGENTLDSAFVADQLFRRIVFHIVHQEVRRRGLSVSDAERDQVRQELVGSLSEGGDEAARRQAERLFRAFPRSYREDLVRSFAELGALERDLQSPVAEEDIRRHYEQQQPSFEATCVRHILLEDQAKAEEVRARLAAGEDFAAVAGAESKDPDSAGRGGDLGCLGRSELESLGPELMGILERLAPGEVSEPVQSQSGFHLIQVTERRTKTLEEATPEIQQLLEGRQAEALDEFLRRALVEADIEVNPRYGRFQESPTPRLVPPGADREPPAEAGPRGPQ